MDQLVELPEMVPLPLTTPPPGVVQAASLYRVKVTDPPGGLLALALTKVALSPTVTAVPTVAEAAPAYVVMA